MAVRIVIHKGANTLTLFRDSQVVKVYPVGTGRDPAFTPEGTFPVVLKTHDPPWTNPATGVTIPGGVPENPLGSRWLGLGVGNTRGHVYGIHGTNRPETIGTHVSLGCVRMYDADAQELYDQVPLGTMVSIVR